jgi:small subunit ribosomal protein S10
MEAQAIRIRLKAFDHRVLDQATGEIAGTARRTGALSAAPFSADQDREVHGERGRTSTRSRASSLRCTATSASLDIVQPNAATVDALMKLDLAAGVNVEINWRNQRAL